MNEATQLDAEWLNQVQAEGERLVREAGVKLSNQDLPDVPLHKRGFGVLDDRNE